MFTLLPRTKVLWATFPHNIVLLYVHCFRIQVSQWLHFLLLLWKQGTLEIIWCRCLWFPPLEQPPSSSCCVEAVGGRKCCCRTRPESCPWTEIVKRDSWQKMHYAMANTLTPAHKMEISSDLNFFFKGWSIWWNFNTTVYLPLLEMPLHSFSKRKKKYSLLTWYT